MRELAMLLLGGLLVWLGRVWAERAQRRELFDHKLRLEKEYQIYCDLWEKLFEFRRAAHGLVDALQEGAQGDPWQEFLDSFDAYQAVVRRNEPFIAPAIYGPARAIVKQGRAIESSTRQLRRLDERRNRLGDWKRDERMADRMVDTDNERQSAMQQIERLFPQVKDAIQKRIMLTPPGKPQQTNQEPAARSDANTA